MGSPQSFCCSHTFSTAPEKVLRKEARRNEVMGLMGPHGEEGEGTFLVTLGVRTRPCCLCENVASMVP